MTRAGMLGLAVLAACGGGGAAPGDLDARSADAAAAVPDASDDGHDWQQLVMSPWTLRPGKEGYRCARRTVPQDVTIRAFRPVAPLGTHHTVLSLDDGNRPDGDEDCGPIAGERAIYMSGVGSPDFEMPDGVGIRLAAGQQIVLNLHLYNTDPDLSLTGVSGVEIVPDTGGPLAQAEVILAGALSFTVEEGRRSLTFRCTTPAPVTLFAIAPHMHRLGSHMKVARGAEVLLDVDYSFDDQRFYPVGNLALAAGDRLDVTCTWDNDTGGPVNFGDSSDEEMCFAVLYRHPVAAGGPFCLF